MVQFSPLLHPSQQDSTKVLVILKHIHIRVPETIVFGILTFMRASTILVVLSNASYELGTFGLGDLEEELRPGHEGPVRAVRPRRPSRFLTKSTVPCGNELSAVTETKGTRD